LGQAKQRSSGKRASFERISGLPGEEELNDTFIVKREPEKIVVEDRKMTQVRTAIINGEEWRFVTLGKTWIAENYETGRLVSAEDVFEKVLSKVVGSRVERERGW
jgi:hypothetical protein